jgi:RNA recognition motif-containing protein
MSESKVETKFETPKKEWNPKSDNPTWDKDAFNRDRDARTVFVKNLPFSATEDDLWNVFGTDEEQTIGVRFIINRDTGAHKGLAFIEYTNPEIAQETIKGMGSNLIFFKI